MKKEHCHEIEVKYRVQANKKEKLAEVLKALGFRPKSTCEVFDRWITVDKKPIRLRVQRIGKQEKYELASKKTITNNAGLKNKCENEDALSDFQYWYINEQATRNRKALPTVFKTRVSFTAKINGRQYTAVIDKVKRLGKFNGFYFELETLVPFDVDDPSAESDVKKLAAKIFRAAYKGSKDKPLLWLMSYRKMALAHMASQKRKRKNKQAAIKQVKPKQARKPKRSRSNHHCQ